MGDFDWMLLLDLLLSVLLGFVIGYERKLRSKEAGIRTHTIVCFGAALMMVISKHAFDGSADSARVAAQIVSGVGFLGAGMIVYRQHEVHGLTTAAGIWVAAGIGMAVAAGLYAVGVATTLLSLAGLEAFGWFFRESRGSSGRDPGETQERPQQGPGADLPA